MSGFDTMTTPPVGKFQFIQLQKPRPYPKSEFRNPKQIQSSNVIMTETDHRFQTLESKHRSMDAIFVICLLVI